jgi:hypothetical protein
MIDPLFSAGGTAVRPISAIDAKDCMLRMR